MSASPVSLDFSKAQPVAQPQAGVSLDFSKSQPLEKKEQPGFLDREIPLDSFDHATQSGVLSIARGVRSAVQGLGQTIAHPIDTAKGTIKSIANAPHQIGQIPGAIHDINQSADPLGTYAKVGQDTAGEGAGQALTALATEGIGKGIGRGVAKVGPPVVRGIVKGANVALDKAPGTIGMGAGGGIGAAISHATGIPGGAEVGGALGYGLGREVLPKIRIPGEHFGFPDRVIGGPKVAPQYVEPLPFKDPGASLPEHPGVFPGATEPTATPEQLNPALISESRSLPGQIGKEVIRPKVAAIARPEPIPPRSGLALPAAPDAVEATPAKVPSPSETARNVSPKATLTNLKQQISDSLGGKTAYEMAGGKPLQDGVAIKNQRPQTNLQQQIADAVEPAAKQTPKAPLTDLQGQIADAANPLPDDFTATPDSSFLKGYKYDPAAQHFEVITNTGERYGRIGITPDQAAAFEQSESKGGAWPELKNSPGAIPTKNGAPRTAQMSYRSASPDDIGEAPGETAKPIAKPSAIKSGATKSTRSAKGKIAAPTAAPIGSNEGDLTATWQQSVDHINAKQGKIASPSAGVRKGTYDKLIDQAMKEGPAWTPEKANPVISALNQNPNVEFEARGSVGEGRSTSNDLDLFQKKGATADAADTLKNLGFKRVATTAHGETWTNGAQHIDIWDSEHEPVKGYSGAKLKK